MELDYRALGFKSGLEVHHQLDTDRKLFCRCPVKLTNRQCDAEILRHMRPTLSELGEYDGTALMEFKTRKNVTYQIFRDLNCTYEMDDTPPFLVNDNALDIAIAIAKTFNMSLVDEVHITRKQYLDGSIPTGFQRTAIIGVGGEFFMRDRRVGIMHMSIEEDSCREVKDCGHEIVFKADRLGFPLVELVTEPEFLTPDDAALGAEAIRRALWNLDMVRRGPGSARHDVNCSITGGTRIEIKGVPRIADIPLLLHNEAYRQKSLLEIKDTLRSRGISVHTLSQRVEDVSNLIRHSDNSVVQKNSDQTFLAVKLKGFGGLLEKQTQENAVFADEFSGRIRVIACLDGVPNILYPESAWAKDINNGIWRKIRRRLNATHHDGIIVVFGGKEDLETAVEEIYIRAREATKGVPPETRQALKNGSNDFERILPGPDRMYPDTDHPPLAITDDRIDSIFNTVPEQPWLREKRYFRQDLPGDIVNHLSISRFAEHYDYLVEQQHVEPIRAGELIGRLIPALKRKGHTFKELPLKRLIELFDLMKQHRVFRESFIRILKKIHKMPAESVETIVQKLGISPIEDKLLNEIIEDKVKIQPVKPFPSENAKVRFYMGLVMNQVRGCVSGSRVLEMVKSRLAI